MRVKPNCKLAGCKREYATTYSDGVTWCFGLRKSASRPCDVVGHCELDRKGRRISGWSLSLDEQAIMVAGMSHVAERATVDRNARCRKRKCREWWRCENGGKGK